MKIEVAGVEGEYNPLPTTPPEGSKAVLSTAMEAVVENNPQPLRRLRSFNASMLHIPDALPAEAKIVLEALFSCFEKQKHVSEGLIGDALWGFEQAARPIPAAVTAKGLIQLSMHNYIKFQAKDHSYVNFESDKIGSAWLRYQPKLLDMVYEK